MAKACKSEKVIKQLIVFNTSFLVYRQFCHYYKCNVEEANGNPLTLQETLDKQHKYASLASFF